MTDAELPITTVAAEAPSESPEFFLNFQHPDWWVMRQPDGGRVRRVFNAGRSLEDAQAALEKYVSSA